MVGDWDNLTYWFKKNGLQRSKMLADGKLTSNLIYKRLKVSGERFAKNDKHSLYKELQEAGINAAMINELREMLDRPVEIDTETQQVLKTRLEICLNESREKDKVIENLKKDILYYRGYIDTLTSKKD